MLVLLRMQVHARWLKVDFMKYHTYALRGIFWGGRCLSSRQADARRNIPKRFQNSQARKISTQATLFMIGDAHSDLNSRTFCKKKIAPILLCVGSACDRHPCFRRYHDTMLLLCHATFTLTCLRQVVLGAGVYAISRHGGRLSYDTMFCVWNGLDSCDPERTPYARERETKSDVPPEKKNEAPTTVELIHIMHMYHVTLVSIASV